MSSVTLGKMHFQNSKCWRRRSNHLNIHFLGNHEVIPYSRRKGLEAVCRHSSSSAVKVFSLQRISPVVFQTFKTIKLPGSQDSKMVVVVDLRKLQAPFLVQQMDLTKTAFFLDNVF